MGKATYTGDGVLRYGDKPHRKGDEVEAPDDVIEQLSKRSDFGASKKPKDKKEADKPADKAKDKDKVI